MKKLCVIFFIYMVSGHASYADHEPDWASIFNEGAKVLHAQTFDYGIEGKYEVQTVMSVLLKNYYDRKNVLAICWHTATQLFSARSNTFACEITNEQRLFHHILE